ncbi:MAG: MarR family transcriptional regulator [Actinomycetota bacterium]|nr:MarR family transcriptional regulator [Actinomycetota bacterium]
MNDELLPDLITAIRDYQIAVEKFDDVVWRALGLNRTDGRCFDVLDHQGPMSAGDLGRAVGLTSGAVTAVIDRLEAKGYAQRSSHPGDRRKVLVEVTTKGRSAARAHYQPLVESTATVLEGLEPSEFELLTRFNRQSAEINEAAAEALIARLAGEGE